MPGFALSPSLQPPLQSRLLAAKVATVSSLSGLSQFDIIRNLVFFLVVLRILRRVYYTLRGYGLAGMVCNMWHSVRVWCYGQFLRAPGVRGKVDKTVREALTDLEGKLCATAGLARYRSLPARGWEGDRVGQELDRLAGMDHTRWEDGRVSGAVYHGGKDLLQLQCRAYSDFAVSNPLHPDVFPGVRKMEAEVVAMVLGLFNAPEGAAGVTTSGGTESILMACLSARQKAYAERGITEPEMIIPATAHAAFEKACKYFGITARSIPCPAPDYKADVAAVSRLINPNTVLLVASAPNFPHGIVDDIPALSVLAETHQLPLHVDCCLGSFVIAFLTRAGFPSPYAAEGGFDFRQPGVTSISCDTHKYGFAPKGSSVVMYRTRKLRSYQYFIMPNWSGGVYASPTIAGSRPGALIAGCWASMMALGESGYTDSCRSIMEAARRFADTLRTHPALAETLRVVGAPMVSVVAFESATPEILIYDVADAMSRRGWHLNALQNPAAVHVAFTVPTAAAVAQLLDDLIAVVEEERARIEENHRRGVREEKNPGNVAALYGVAGSMPNKSVVNRLAEGFLDALYIA